MALKYPPNFDKNKIYPRILDLDLIDVYIDDAPNGTFFAVSGPNTIGYGKHLYGLYNTAYANSDGQKLKSQSKILFEGYSVVDQSTV